MPNRDNVITEIGLLIYPESQLAAVYGLTDLFRVAAQWAIDGEQRDDAPAIRVSHWQADEARGAVTCIWDSHPDAEHRLSHVIAPPSLVVPESMQAMPAAGAWMSQWHEAGATVCSVCAGAFVLAESGLIDGRRATTHWAFARQLAKRFPGVEVMDERMVIDDGDIMTAGGILAWTDLGLTLVERFLGPSTMLATARFLLIDPPRHLQRPFAQFMPPFDHGDEAILKTQHLIHARFADIEAVASLAAFANMGERTFLRKFSGATGYKPSQYIQQVRIARARELLEHTQRPVEQVAWQVGYGDPAAFRKNFHKIVGIAPAAYRQRFGVAGSEAADDVNALGPV